MEQDQPTHTRGDESVTPLPPVPETWPGAFGIYNYSKAAVKFNLGTVLTLFLGSLIISWVARYLRLPGVIIGDLILLLLSIASLRAYVAGVRRQTIALEEALKGCTPRVVLYYVLNSIVVAILMVFSLALLIVPFFFVFPRLLLAGYFVVDGHLGPIAAIRASWDSTRGHAGKLWGIVGANFAIALLFITIIGIPVALYLLFMYSAAFAVAYLYVTRTPALPAEPAAPASPSNEA